jgi:hypothetical protein
MSADESHSAKVKRGMQLAREHKAGEHVEFNVECTHCRNEAKERGKRPAYPAAPTRPDTTRDVPLGTFPAGELPPPPGSVTVMTLPAEPVIPTTETTAPKPGMTVSPTEVPGKTDAEKEKEHRAALAAAAEVEKEARVPIPPIAGGPGKRGGDSDGELVFHVLADGFTVLGAVWYRGQEIGIRSGSANDELSTDKTGHRWYEMTDNEQMTRFGQKMFGVGPWPYSAPVDAADDEAYIRALNSSDPGAMREYEKQKQRQTKPPVPASR